MKRTLIALVLALPMVALAVEPVPVNTDRAVPATQQTAEQAVNINTATESELMSLDGVGLVKAKAIIEYRTTNGPFTSAESLTNVKGIGGQTMIKNAGRITVK